MLRARDKMDRAYNKPLDVAALAKVAMTSEAHVIRTFKETFGETPHRYLQRRRLERAMARLRETERPVTRSGSTSASPASAARGGQHAAGDDQDLRRAGVQ
jgi:AraC-like DNA-binding protein